MSGWIRTLQSLVDRQEPAMMVTVLGIRGSAPRECGAKMIVTATELTGSIGGGQLEYQCAQIACEQLKIAGEEPASNAFLRRFPLGASCGQCCGGVAEILFEKIETSNASWFRDATALYRERMPVVIATALGSKGMSRYLVTAENCLEYGNPASAGLREAMLRMAREESLPQARALNLKYRDVDNDSVSVLLEPVMTGNFNVALFGAGHVGSAVVAAMSGLDCDIRWIDSRRDIFPEHLPERVVSVESASPEREVAAIPADACYLVMTHSHALDFEICARILERRDVAYCGLIGSLAKRRRFEKLMRKKGLAEESLQRLTCPIGIPGIDSKKPQAIAIAVAAELLQKRSASVAREALRRDHLHVLRA